MGVWERNSMTLEVEQQLDIQNDLDEENVHAKEGASGLLKAVDDARPVASRIRKYTMQQQKALIELASAVVAIRASLILSDGLPDWLGTSRAHKTAVGHLLDAAMPDFESKAVTVNRVNKFVLLQLPLAVLNTVLAEEAIQLTEYEKRYLLSLGPDASNFAHFKLIVKAVNRHYRVGLHLPGPTSPFRRPTKTSSV